MVVKVGPARPPQRRNSLFRLESGEANGGNCAEGERLELHWLCHLRQSGVRSPGVVESRWGNLPLFALLAANAALSWFAAPVLFDQHSLAADAVAVSDTLVVLARLGFLCLILNIGLKLTFVRFAAAQQRSTVGIPGLVKWHHGLAAVELREIEPWLALFNVGLSPKYALMGTGHMVALLVLNWHSVTPAARAATIMFMLVTSFVTRAQISCSAQMLGTFIATSCHVRHLTSAIDRMAPGGGGDTKGGAMAVDMRSIFSAQQRLVELVDKTTECWQGYFIVAEFPLVAIVSCAGTGMLHMARAMARDAVPASSATALLQLYHFFGNCFFTLYVIVLIFRAAARIHKQGGELVGAANRLVTRVACAENASQKDLAAAINLHGFLAANEAAISFRPFGVTISSSLGLSIVYALFSIALAMGIDKLAKW